MNFALVVVCTFGLMSEVALADRTAGIIPSKEEQTNLLRNVEEVFKAIKRIVNDEGGATDDAVIEDVERMVERAVNYLSLVEDIALMKLSSQTSENPLCRKQATPRVQKVVEEGQRHLNECIEQTVRNIQNNSQVVTEATGEAVSEGQLLVDTLNQCSKKVALQQISCYKKIMANDVFPLKVILVDALDIHKNGHLEAISIKKRANDCVDDVLVDSQTRVAQIVRDAIASCIK